MIVVKHLSMVVQYDVRFDPACFDVVRAPEDILEAICIAVDPIWRPAAQDLRIERGTSIGDLKVSVLLYNGNVHIDLSPSGLRATFRNVQRSDLDRVMQVLAAVLAPVIDFVAPNVVRSELLLAEWTANVLAGQVARDLFLIELCSHSGTAPKMEFPVTCVPAYKVQLMSKSKDWFGEVEIATKWGSDSALYLNFNSRADLISKLLNNSERGGSFAKAHVDGLHKRLLEFIDSTLAAVKLTKFEN